MARGDFFDFLALRSRDDVLGGFYVLVSIHLLGEKGDVLVELSMSVEPDSVCEINRGCQVKSGLLGEFVSDIWVKSS